MAERIRVRDDDTGYTRTISETDLPHGNYTRLKDAAVDPVTGDDVPPTYGDAAPGYADLTVAQLTDEIARRNQGRLDDDLIRPAAPGNKPELIAALEGDDQPPTKENN